MNRLETLISVLMKPLQRFENTAVQLLTQRTVDTAAGAQLDVLGRIVGQSRQGQLDVDYARYIRARIAANRATGKREELINIARLVLGTDAGTVWIRSTGDASFILEIHDLAITAGTARALQEMLTSAVAVGVRIIIEYAVRPLATTFRLDSGPGLDQGHLARAIDDTGAP